ncbi:hypothetical protein HDV06_006724 [Boothiomyces sp. JEL0866]|nr:hypothetical protein HDV06_006724 [Boothiomyces sp. JEL0866]
MQISEETRERIQKVLELSKKALHVGWIPFILYMGMTASVSRPSILKIISPFAA